LFSVKCCKVGEVPSVDQACGNVTIGEANCTPRGLSQMDCGWLQE